MDLYKDKDNERVLFEYFTIVRRRKFILINCVVFCIIFAVIYSFKMKPVYLSNVQILIERNTPRAVSVQETMSLDAGDMQYYQTQYQLLKSRDLAKNVIQQLHLEESAIFQKEPQLINFAFLKELRVLLFQIGIVKEMVLGEITQDPYSSLVNTFLGKLIINPIRNTRLVNIGFEAHSPYLAAKISNAVADMYIIKNIDLRASIEIGAGEWLGSRIKEIKESVERSDLKLQRFLDSNNIIGFDRDKQDIVSQKLIDLNSEVTKARAERVRLETVAEQLEGLKNNPIEMLQSIPDSVKSEVILQLNKDYLSLRRDHSEKSQKFGPKHPIMISISQKVKVIEEKIPEEIGRLLRAVEIDFKASLAREKSMFSALKVQKREVRGLNKSFVKYNLLKQDAKNHKRLYDVLVNRMKETNLSSKFNESNIRIVDPAEIPSSPIRPRTKINIIIAMIMGALGGIFLIFLRESLDMTVNSLETIERQLRMPFLGAMGLFNKKDGMLPMVDHLNSQRSDEIRVLRTNILHAAPDNPKKTILVTSTTPMEGKTTVVTNLATGFAQISKNVLILDCDLRKSKLHTVFKIKPEPGLSEFLFDEVELKAVIRKTKIKGLSIIPRGSFTPYSSEIFSSKKFDSLFNAVRNHFDIVLIDSPPTLNISDTTILAKKCDGIVFVIKAECTDIRLVDRALKHFSMGSAETVGSGVEKNKNEGSDPTTKILGIVLNMFNYKKEGYYGDYEKTYGGYYSS